jgi:ClpX C4-type zinc finger
VCPGWDKLIAGPRVFICNECVEVCNDILADDARFEEQTGKKARVPTDDSPAPWPNVINCVLCRVPISVDERIVLTGNRGTLCRDCVNAVEATRQPLG